MTAQHSRAFPAVLLFTAVGLAACGSDGDDDPIVDGAPTSQNPLAIQDADGDTGADDDLALDADDGTDDPTDESDDAPPGDDVPPFDDAVPDGAAPDGDGEADVPVDGGGSADGDPDDDGPGDDIQAPTADVSRLGLLVVGSPGVEEGDVSRVGTVAAFYGLADALPASALTEGLLPEADTCTLGRADDDGPSTVPTVPDDAIDAGIEPLSAGDNIVLTGPGGTFATLVRTEADGQVVYLPENGGVPAPVPAPLTADIPGDGFPAFTAVAVPDASPPAGVTPAGLEGVTAGSTFEWEAGAGDGSSRVQIVLAVDGTDPVVTVSCWAADDGEFRLPTSLLARVPAEQGATATLSRRTVDSVQQGDALLLLGADSAVQRRAP